MDSEKDMSEDVSDIRNIRRRLNAKIEADKLGHGPGVCHPGMFDRNVYDGHIWGDTWFNNYAVEDMGRLLDLVEPLFAWDVPNWIRYLRTQGDDQIADALEVLLGFEPYPWSPEAEEGSP